MKPLFHRHGGIPTRAYTFIGEGNRERTRWFERLLAELGFEVWSGDPAEIKTKRVKKQKTDREDPRLLLRLLRENNFPRIWIPSPEIGICDNCCGTVIGWCRCAHGS